MIIKINLTECSFDFLLVLLGHKASFSTANKAEILTELSRRNDSEDKAVVEPH